MAVNRTFIANSTISSNQIEIYSPDGLPYIPELATEGGDSITTENGTIILLG
jgi:hypothetical protein